MVGIKRDSDSFRLVNTNGQPRRVRLFGAYLGNPYADSGEFPPPWDNAAFITTDTITGIIYNQQTDRLYLSVLFSGTNQKAVALTGIGGTLAIDSQLNHADIFDDLVIGSWNNLFLRRELLTGDWWGIDIDGGTTANLGALPSGAIINDIDNSSSKTTANPAYSVAVTPSTGARVTTLLETAQVQSSALPNAGRASLTKDSLQRIYTHDENVIYSLDYDRAVDFGENQQKVFRQYAQLPARAYRVVLFAESKAQLSQEIIYGNCPNNEERLERFFPQSKLGAWAAQPIAELSFNKNGGIIMDGFHYLDFTILPQSELTVLFEFERVLYGLQGYQYR